MVTVCFLNNVLNEVRNIYSQDTVVPANSWAFFLNMECGLATLIFLGAEGVSSA